MTRWLLRLAGRYSFILTLLGLCFLCFALAEAKAKADTLGLPYNLKFQAASYPYARILTGCTEWRQPTRFQESWGPVSFAGACQNHDLCFHTPPKNYLDNDADAVSWGDCNKQYLKDLRMSCDRDLKKARLEKGELGDPDAAALQLCYEIANLFFERVQNPEVVRRFKIAQEMAAAYEGWVADVLEQTLRKYKGQNPSRRELREAFAALDNGHDIDFIEKMASTTTLGAMSHQRQTEASEGLGLE